MVKINLDSNLWIAIFRLNDSCHTKAVKIFSKLDQQKTQLIISSLVFAEVCTVVSQRESRRQAILVGRELRKPELVFDYFDSELDLKTWELFQKISDKNISYVDCGLLALSLQKGYLLATLDGKLQKIAKNFNCQIFR